MVHKGTSPATQLANRTNALKSTGPVTERGQLISRRNALKHWGRAETIRPLLAALEEEPEEFDRLRDALYRSLAPRDEFEALLVDDMADVHWRIRRMVRAEAGSQAKHRRTRKTWEEEIEARFDAGKFHDLERTTIPTMGFVGLQDSPVKFRRVLEILRTVSELVREGGFVGEMVVFLQQLYGYNPSERARKVMNTYDRCYQERDCGDPAHIEANHAGFQEVIADEIAWFERRAASHLQSRAELRAPILEAELLKTECDPSRIAACHERLEKVFEKKWRLLMEYRDRQEAGMQQADDSETGQIESSSALPADQN